MLEHMDAQIVYFQNELIEISEEVGTYFEWEEVENNYFTLSHRFLTYIR
ncbi:hypothetical protein [Litchfieldia alkalitelluris]|nr:hypothetical protein [Litchfieldia alkalitelluris]